MSELIPLIAAEPMREVDNENAVRACFPSPGGKGGISFGNAQVTKILACSGTLPFRRDVPI
jgi:hypothetical protein